MSGSAPFTTPSQRHRILLDVFALGAGMAGMQWLLPLTTPGMGPMAGLPVICCCQPWCWSVGCSLATWPAWCCLPRLTGFIVIGVLVGPYVMGLVSKDQVSQIKLVNDLAIGLIALMAGAEIRLSWLQARLGQICTFVAMKSVTVPVVISGMVLLFAGVFPFVAAAAGEGVPAWTVAVLAGVLAIANSPMVVVSVIKDTGSTGPVSELAIGTAVATDVVVIMAFTIVIALIDGLTAEGGSGMVGLLLASGGGTLALDRPVSSRGIDCRPWAWLGYRTAFEAHWMVVGRSCFAGRSDCTGDPPQTVVRVDLCGFCL